MRGGGTRLLVSNPYTIEELEEDITVSGSTKTVRFKINVKAEPITYILHTVNNCQAFTPTKVEIKPNFTNTGTEYSFNQELNKDIYIENFIDDDYDISSAEFVYIRFIDANNNYSPYYRVNPNQESVELLSSTLDVNVIIPYMDFYDQNTEYKFAICGDIFISGTDPDVQSQIANSGLQESGLKNILTFTSMGTSTEGTLVCVFTNKNHPVYLTPNEKFRLTMFIDTYDNLGEDLPTTLDDDDLEIRNNVNAINKIYDPDNIGVLELINDKLASEGWYQLSDSYYYYFTLNDYQVFNSIEDYTSIFDSSYDVEDKFVLRDSSGHITKIINNIPLKATSTSVDFKINDQPYLHYENKLTIDSPFTIIPRNVNINQLAGYDPDPDPDPEPQLIPLIFTIKEYPDFSAGRYWPKEDVKTISFQFY